MALVRLLAAGFGAVFGFVLAWTQMTDPDVIRKMLLLEDAYLYLVMFSAIGTAFLGVRVLRWLHLRALVTRRPIAWTPARPERRHIEGSLVFGAGWALSSSCPGPIAAQLGQGMAWSAATIAGVVIGIVTYARMTRRAESREVAE
jgi:uncharacterized membrane protein YedE/YeeE